MEPRQFSSLGYILIIVGFVLIIVYGGLAYSGAGSGTGYFFIAYSIGASMVTVGAIFAAAGHITEHLRPAKPQT